MGSLSAYYQRNHLLTEQQGKFAESCFKEECYPKGSLIQQPTGPCRKAYFIAHGYVRQSYWQDGNEITAYVYNQQEFFTDLRSFLAGQPARYHFHAVTDCQLLSITKEKLDHLFSVDPCYERWGRVIFQRITLDVIEAAERLLFLAPEEPLDLPNRIKAITLG